MCHANPFADISTQVTETEFNAEADATLAAIASALDASQAQCDCEFRGEGLIELEFEDAGKIVVNRHTAAREIWVAARSGGFHFRFDGARWINTRDGTELYSALSKLVSQQSGLAVILRRP